MSTVKFKFSKKKIRQNLPVDLKFTNQTMVNSTRSLYQIFVAFLENLNCSSIWLFLQRGRYFDDILKRCNGKQKGKFTHNFISLLFLIVKGVGHAPALLSYSKPLSGKQHIMRWKYFWRSNLVSLLITNESMQME